MADRIYSRSWMLLLILILFSCEQEERRERETSTLDTCLEQCSGSVLMFKVDRSAWSHEVIEYVCECRAGAGEEQ